MVVKNTIVDKDIRDRLVDLNIGKIGEIVFVPSNNLSQALISIGGGFIDQGYGI